MNKGTEEWLTELESFGMRWERLIDEYENGEMTLKRIIEWLDAAYGRGHNDCLKEHTN